MLSRYLLLTAIVGSLILSDAHSETIAAQTPMFEDRPEFSTVTWITGDQFLPFSHATLVAPPGSRAIVGNAVHTFNEGYDPGDVENGSLQYEEAILRFDHHGTVHYDYLLAGYTIDDDFAALNPDALFKQMQASDCPCGPFKWGQKPTYDARRHVVTWMVLEHHPSGETLYMAYADIYLRYERESISAATRDRGAAVTYAELQQAIDAFVIPRTVRYKDHEASDPKRGTWHIKDATMGDAAHVHT